MPIYQILLYRQQIRSQLKEQVKEKDESLRKQLIERVAESDAAVASDKKSKEEDNSVKQKKADYLKQFSNENKKVSRSSMILFLFISGLKGVQPVQMTIQTQYKPNNREVKIPRSGVRVRVIYTYTYP